MAEPAKATVVYHADWSTDAPKRWCAKATLGADGRYTASAPQRVGNPDVLIEQLRQQAGEAGCAFVGFDFPIGVPAFYGDRAGISNFRDLLPRLGIGEWKDFYTVCDHPHQISVRRPFYPNGGYKGRRKQDLFRGHDVSAVEFLLRHCERGGEGRKEACCLFWTLGGNQVGKAAIAGWRDVLAPALRNKNPVSLWPFAGTLSSLLVPGSIVIAETYPAECYGWFSDDPLGSKRDPDDRKKFGASLLRWADAHSVIVEGDLREEMQGGFSHGEDDAFDAVVGLFGMLQVALGQPAPGEPNDRVIRAIEGWILGRK